jgi:hypothetical protein
MANTLTALAPVLYKAAQITPRELCGMIASVDQTFDAKMVAKGDTVKVPIISAGSAGDYTPAMTTTAGSNTTPTTVSLSMDYSREYSFHLTGEEEQSLQNGGDNAKEFLRQSTEQGLRTLVNEIDAALCVAAKNGASRATGTAATTPFATTLDVIPDAVRILNDNGTPTTDRYIVLSSAAATNLRKLVTVNNQPSGSPAEVILSGGTLVNLHGCNIRESKNYVTHTKGAATGFDCTAIEPVGEVTIACDGSNSGTVLAGDIVTRGNEGGSTADTNKYVVYSGSTLTGAASGNFILNKPGVILATAATDEWTIGGSYTPNIAMHKSAIKLVARPPYIPASPLIETTMIGDGVSGLTFMFSRIVGDGMTTYRLNIVYGYVVVQPQYIATILG